MGKSRHFGILSIGILFGALFPFGLHTLLFKIFERILFLSDLNILFSSAIAAYTSVILTVILFIKTMNMLVISDLNQKIEIKKKIKIGVFVNLSLYFVWFLIPFIDNNLGIEYSSKIYRTYEILSTEFFWYEILINQLSSIICFSIIIGIMYQSVNTIGSEV
jgi:hypothetical protein